MAGAAVEEAWQFQKWMPDTGTSLRSIANTEFSQEAKQIVGPKLRHVLTSKIPVVYVYCRACEVKCTHTILLMRTSKASALELGAVGAAGAEGDTVLVFQGSAPFGASRSRR